MSTPALDSLDFYTAVSLSQHVIMEKTHLDLTQNTDEENYLLAYVVSPQGRTVNVFSICVNGSCVCSYYIGDVLSQLKPCRFASLILQSGVNGLDTYMDLLWWVTDGFPIIEGNVPSYECENYSSITCIENKAKMDSIVRKELSEGCVSRCFSKPICVHALGAVPKGVDKIRQITDCSRPLYVSVASMGCINGFGPY